MSPHHVVVTKLNKIENSDSFMTNYEILDTDQGINLKWPRAICIIINL